MASGDLNRPLGAIGRLEGSLGGPRLILSWIWGVFWKARGRVVWTKITFWNVTFPHMLSEWFLVGSSWETLELEKNCKFVGPSLKNKVSLNWIQSGFRRSPESITSRLWGRFGTHSDHHVRSWGIVSGR